MANLDNITILVLEDNSHMALILREIMRGFGLRDIREARDVATAFEILKDNHIDIALVDHNLGDLDGNEFVQLIRNADDSPNPYIQIIMVTAHGDRATVMGAIRSGANEFMVKPVTPLDLYEKLRSCIENPRQFVRTSSYFGPDRRRRQDPVYRGPWRREIDPEGGVVPEECELDKAGRPKVIEG
ncbi:MAG: response regulator [Robiginitomaculum sp.]|nr:response regulator [Robiginitomaculum sp.]